MQIVSRVSDNPHAKFGDNRSKTAKKNVFFQFLSDRSVGLVCILKKFQLLVLETPCQGSFSPKNLWRQLNFGCRYSNLIFVIFVIFDILANLVKND